MVWEANLLFFWNWADFSHATASAQQRGAHVNKGLQPEVWPQHLLVLLWVPPRPAKPESWSPHDAKSSSSWQSLITSCDVKSGQAGVVLPAGLEENVLHIYFFLIPLILPGGVLQIEKAKADCMTGSLASAAVTVHAETSNTDWVQHVLDRDGRDLV